MNSQEKELENRFRATCAENLRFSNTQSMGCMCVGGGQGMGSGWTHPLAQRFSWGGSQPEEARAGPLSPKPRVRPVGLGLSVVLMTND